MQKNAFKLDRLERGFFCLQKIEATISESFHLILSRHHVTISLLHEKFCQYLLSGQRHHRRGTGMPLHCNLPAEQCVVFLNPLEGGKE